ncbi:RNA polymerase sigma factor [Candidatus Pacearchaeota archaeon]|nr:RNA polymerase sigma factor [Candidatus Pacearchaeota archaeon]
MNLEKLSDKELMDKAKQNGCLDQVMEEIYRRYYPKIVNIGIWMGLSYDSSQDLAQNTLIKVFSNPHRYDPKKGGVYNWISKITMNSFIDYQRKRKTKKEDPMDYFDLNKMSDLNGRSVSDPESDLLSKEKVSGLMKAIQGLSEMYKRPVEDYYLFDFTTGEIARNLGLSNGTIRVRLHTARKKLKKKLRAYQ